MLYSQSTTHVMTSALYEGTSWHERRTPFLRRFTMKMWFAYLDVDDLPQIEKRSVLFSTHRFRPVRFRRSDYFGDENQSLGDSIRQYVHDQTGEHVDGKIFILSQLRTWGWCFNPLSLYYCFSATGRLRWVVAEVTNTPWKERTTYLLPATDVGVIDDELPKQMHVSPLWPMSQRYRFALSAPSQTLSVRIDNVATEGPETGKVVHSAGLELQRNTLTNRNLALLLVRRPALTHRVTIGIHRHAAVLKMRGATFYSHPRQIQKKQKGQMK